TRQVRRRHSLSLSGGLRMRCALACAFFMSPDVLLLDEPTNHLDLPTVLWLETMLRGYKGTFLLVTQDTVLLESAVTSVLLIADQKLKYFPCDFKEFKVRKEQEDTHQEKMRSENLNPMSPLIKQENRNIERKGIRQARNVLMHMKGGIDHQKADDATQFLAANVSAYDHKHSELGALREKSTSESLKTLPAERTKCLTMRKGLLLGMICLMVIILCICVPLTVSKPKNEIAAEAAMPRIVSTNITSFLVSSTEQFTPVIA
ncbi:P-loop containing nucleoside triphosphate hydrolase protein, partial [Chytriomyces cf. hyalinus JEL632]